MGIKQIKNNFIKINLHKKLIWIRTGFAWIKFIANQSQLTVEKLHTRNNYKKIVVQEFIGSMMLTAIKLIRKEYRTKLRLMQPSMPRFTQTSYVRIWLSLLNLKRNCLSHQIVFLQVLDGRAMLAILIVNTLIKKRVSQLILLSNRKVLSKDKD